MGLFGIKYTDESQGIEGDSMCTIVYNSWLEESYQMSFLSSYGFGMFSSSSEFWIDSSNNILNITIRLIILKPF